MWVYKRMCDGMCLSHDDVVVVDSNNTWNRDQSYMGAVADPVSYRVVPTH